MPHSEDASWSSGVKLAFCIQMIFFLMLLMCHSTSVANDFKAEIATQDGRAKLRVYWSLPAIINKNVKVPAVIVVPGTFDSADPFFDPMNPDFSLPQDGMSGLGEKLNQMGLAVFRYDTRGVIAGRECMQGRTAALSIKEYITSCRIESDLMQVNFKSLRSDLAQVIAYAKGLPQVDAEKLGIISISEGFLHAANLVGSNRISDVKILAGMGAAIEAPKTIYVKQRYLNLVNLLKNQFTGKPDEVLDIEVLTEIAERKLSKGDWISLLFPGKTKISLADVLAIQASYEKQLADEFDDTSRAAPASIHMRKVNGISIVERSMAYWQDFTTNANSEMRPLDELSNFDGVIRIFYGGNDDRVDVVASAKVIDQFKNENRELSFRIYEGLGHKLDEKNKRIPHFVLSDIAKEFSILLQ